MIRYPFSLSALTVDAVAAGYASLAEDDGDQAIDNNAQVAIRERRIDDVVFWQRVRFRARLLRAIEQRKWEHDLAPTSDPAMTQSAD